MAAAAGPGVPGTFDGSLLAVIFLALISEEENSITVFSPTVPNWELCAFCTMLVGFKFPCTKK